jgi:hypothetical protein
MVEVPAPGAAIGFGLNVMLVPLGAPLADSEIDEMNPFNGVVVTVEFP